MTQSSSRNRKWVRTAVSAALIASLAACGGGSSGAGTDMNPPPAQTSPMAVLVSDAASDDWATVGVRIVSIALMPQGGGAAVTVYAPATPPLVNLEQLDQIGELLGNAPVPLGTYAGATVTIGANPGDVELVVAAEPEAGFAGRQRL